MTIKELIGELKEFDQDLQVYIDTEEIGKSEYKWELIGWIATNKIEIEGEKKLVKVAILKLEC